MMKKSPGHRKILGPVLGAALALGGADAAAGEDARCAQLAGQGWECARLSPALLSAPALKKNAEEAWGMLPSSIRAAAGDDFDKISPREKLARLGALFRAATEAALAAAGPEIAENIPIAGARVEQFSGISHLARAVKISSPALEGFAARLVGAKILVGGENLRVVWGAGDQILAAGISGESGPVDLKNPTEASPAVVIPAQGSKN